MTLKELHYKVRHLNPQLVNFDETKVVRDFGMPKHVSGFAVTAMTTEADLVQTAAACVIAPVSLGDKLPRGVCALLFDDCSVSDAVKIAALNLVPSGLPWEPC